MGPEDLACHSSKGLTKRTQTLFGPAGRAYVYFIYGMYDMFNIVAHRPGGGQAVLVRAAEPLDGWDADLSGPGKLARAFHITRADNGADLTADRLFLLDAAAALRIATTPRIGIDYSRHWKDVPLRFIDADSRAVSGRRPRLAGPIAQTASDTVGQNRTSTFAHSAAQAAAAKCHSSVSRRALGRVSRHRS